MDNLLELSKDVKSVECYCYGDTSSVFLVF